MSTYLVRIFVLVFLITAGLSGCKKDNNQNTPGPINGSWAQLSTTGSPQERHECSFALLNEKGYLLGGRGDLPVEELDLKTNTWRKLASPGYELNHFQAIAFNGEIWLAGAFTGDFPHETPVSKIVIFSPGNNQWREGAEIPTARRRGGAGAFTYDGKIYIVCGITDGHWTGNVSWFDEYDPATGKWTQLPDAPHARDHFNAVVINNQLYLAGGRRTSEITGELFDLTVPELDVYDFKKKTWTTFSADKNIPTPRAGCAAVNVNGQLVVIGGESGAQEQAHNNCEAFNPATSVWTSLPPMKAGRHGTQAFVYNADIYIAAGSANRGGGPELNSTEKFTVQ